MVLQELESQLRLEGMLSDSIVPPLYASPLSWT